MLMVSTRGVALLIEGERLPQREHFFQLVDTFSFSEETAMHSYMRESLCTSLKLNSSNPEMKIQRSS